MKKEYKIPCSWQVYATAEVEAESWDDAIQKVEEDDFPLPTDPDYVDASFEVDYDIVEYAREEEEKNKTISFPTGNNVDFGTSME